MLGTPRTPNATKAMLLGCGELGKEVCIELQRLGVQVVAVDRYENAPAMQVAHSFHVVDMLDGEKLAEIIEAEKPDYIIPEIEAIATSKLVELEAKGYKVVPSSNAALTTMDREKIRTLAAETLKLPTSKYVFAQTFEEFKEGVKKIGIPCVVKPVMSSSGKGQSIIKSEADIEKAWNIAHDEGRGHKDKVIIEEFLKFDYEITLLTVKAVDGFHFCPPIGHRQEDGDYRESWQPQAMNDNVLVKAQFLAKEICDALDGYGIFGVELFIRGDEVIFSEVSPRPHDTGMVTMISQNFSEFALHVRAILGLPIGNIINYGPSASVALLGQGTSKNITFDNLANALEYAPSSQIRLFGKPEINGRRRLGVVLSQGSSVQEAVKLGKKVAENIKIIYN
ncbi:MAG: formate-dependent phosphoribosylglycinamide formyltransferase [Succinivibrionaceae bacterium]|nr:formate-dependent phosphoribosylglycinamide formyltransferase [Ruminobacter sp.]MDY5780083.1 formate-dependent phosphoribosylglycinamide formyltransferase [Succinivibrionaceae bacterium]MEE1340013.1 formate-dependent phosphoribosylglycinamide formyltransferase [Succinivibrionaceae bacterium]